MATEKSPATGHIDHVMLSRRSHILAVPLGMLFAGAHPTQTNKLCLDEPAFGHPKFFGVQRPDHAKHASFSNSITT